MKFKELKNKSAKELQKILADSQHSLRELRFKISSDQLKNIREIRAVKRTVAKVLFLLNSKRETEVKSAKGGSVSGVKELPKEEKNTVVKKEEVKKDK